MGQLDNWGYDAADQAAPPVFDPEHFEDEDYEARDPAKSFDHSDHGDADGAEQPPSEQLTLDEDEIPDFVFIPSEYPADGVSEETRLQLRRVAGGGLALLTYSSLDLLVENFGDNQAWIAVPGGKVQELLMTTGANVAVLDAPIDPGQLEDETNG